ncbi:hypothetical protein BDN71DRAFT_1435016 [Pleurotus eryngii]|uniref:Uncharacterized protein n=1 Tax=Pleurotus eryngii TaxID=5323 RepID=A0A9P5ZMW4_PLEER|nr:hypothetical protein BDN71DRAFT_1435016 [Pleurotus eryngii]
MTTYQIDSDDHHYCQVIVGYDYEQPIFYKREFKPPYYLVTWLNVTNVYPSTEQCLVLEMAMKGVACWILPTLEEAQEAYWDYCHDHHCNNINLCFSAKLKCPLHLLMEFLVAIAPCPPHPMQLGQSHTAIVDDNVPNLDVYAPVSLFNGERMASRMSVEPPPALSPASSHVPMDSSQEWTSQLPIVYQHDEQILLDGVDAEWSSPLLSVYISDEAVPSDSEPGAPLSSSPDLHSSKTTASSNYIVDPSGGQ